MGIELIELAVFAVGIMVGAIGYVLGIGGGIIIVPLLILMFDMSAHEAVAISLVIITINSISTSSKHIKSGMANLPMGLAMSLTAVIGSLGASLISINMDQNIILLILGGVQILAAILTYVKTRITSQYIPATHEDKDNFFVGRYFDKAINAEIAYKPIRVIQTSLISVFAGIFAGIAGVGGGILLLPPMNIISKFPMKAATATSSFVIGFTASLASIVYISAGYLTGSLFWIANMILGVYLGTYISSKLFSSITDKKVSYLLIALLIIASSQMFYKGLGLNIL